MQEAPQFRDFLATDARESHVNAVWFQLLATTFPFPYYVIAPEYNTTHGRADLMVHKVRLDQHEQVTALTPVFAYEGKEKCTEQAFAAIAQQGKGYIKQDLPRLYSEWRYGMIAAGEKVAVIATSDGFNIYQVLKPDLTKIESYYHGIKSWDIGLNRKEWQGVLGAIKVRADAI